MGDVAVLDHDVDREADGQSAWTRRPEGNGSTLITTASVGTRSGLRSNTLSNGTPRSSVPVSAGRARRARWLRRAAAVAAGVTLLATWPTSTQDADLPVVQVDDVVAAPAPSVEQHAHEHPVPAPVDADGSDVSQTAGSRLADLAAAEADRDRAAAEIAAEAQAAAQPAPASTPSTQGRDDVAPAPAPAPPRASTTSTTPTLPRHERIGREALTRLRFIDVAALGWRIEFHPGRSGFLGIADWERRTVDVWIRDSHDVQDVLGTIAHELAHVYDYEHWDQGVRDTWLELRGLDIEWWPSCTCDDRGFGAGDIAEAMVILEAGAGEWTGRFGQPTRAQLDWLATQI